MMQRRALLLSTLAFVAAAALGPPALAAPDFKSLTPLLIDLPGFDGEKAAGMTMDVGSGPMTTVSRQYKRGAAHVGVTVVMGEAAKGALAPVQMKLSMETADGHMKTTEIAGFKALETYHDASKSGNVLIAVADATLFSLEYRGLSEDEAVGLAQKFDLKALAAAK
jgi:hypothetical protein